MGGSSRLGYGSNWVILLQVEANWDGLTKNTFYPESRVFFQMESSVSPLCVFVALSGSFGCSWIAGLTSGFRCNVVGMESGDLLLPAHIDEEKNFVSLKEPVGIGDATIISKELLSGPKGFLCLPVHQILLLLTPLKGGLLFISTLSCSMRTMLSMHIRLTLSSNIMDLHLRKSLTSSMLVCVRQNRS